MVAIESLYRCYLSSCGVSIDSRCMQPHGIFFAIRGVNYNGNAFAKEALAKGARWVVVDDKTYMDDHPAYILVDDAQHSLEALARYHRSQCEPPYGLIAVTGSYGKTTTKELLRSILSTTYRVVATQGNLNTSLGVALTILSMDKKTQLAIVEMGASQKGDIEKCCNIAQPTHGLITAIGPDHLQGFHSIQGVLEGKLELYHYLSSKEGTVFVNSTDPLLVDASRRLGKRYTYPQSQDDLHLSLVDQTPYLRCKVTDGPVLHTQLLGAHHYYNLAAALCVAKYFGVPHSLAYAAVQDYRSERGRMELVCKGSNQLIIDSYNASPDAVRSALLTILRLKVKRRIVILGDMADLGGDAIAWHKKILALLADKSYDLVLLCGPLFLGALGRGGDVRMIGFREKSALVDYLSREHFEDCGFLLKGSHHMSMHTLVDAIG